MRDLVDNFRLAHLAVVISLVDLAMVGTWVSGLFLAVSFAALIAEKVTTPPPDRSLELEGKMKALEDRLGRLEFKAGMPR